MINVKRYCEVIMVNLPIIVSGRGGGVFRESLGTSVPRSPLAVRSGRFLYGSVGCARDGASELAREVSPERTRSRE